MGELKQLTGDFVDKAYAGLVAEQLVESNDHRIVLCGSLTGHFMRAVALCESPSDARAIRTGLAALKRHETLVSALREAALQITYLHDKFDETGTGNAVLAKIDAALSEEPAP